MATKNLAINDVAATNEDTALNINVLANDLPPSMVKKLYSLDQVLSDGLTVVPTATSKLGATITINANGTVNYDPTGSAMIQALAQGETATDTFIYTMKETSPSGGSTLNTATVTVTLTGVNDPPTIAGTAPGQATTDTASINPFSNVTIGDVDHNAQDSLTIKLTDANGNATDTNGALSGNGLQKTGTGTYSLAATSPAALTTELDQLVFTPTAHQGPAGTTVTTDFSLAANDGYTTTTNSTTSVVTTETLPNIVGYSLTVLDVQSPIVDNTFANDINDSSEVVGSYGIHVANGSEQFTGFTDINGIISSVLVPGSFDTSVSGVNNKGDLIGTWNDGVSTPNHGFVERAGTNVFTPLPEVFTGQHVVITEGINSAGTAVYFDQGAGVNGFAHTRSFSYDAAGNLNEIIPTGAVGTPDTIDTFVSAINDNNVIVGYFEDDLGVHGFIAPPGGTQTTVDVQGATETVILGVNNFGDVVGAWTDASNQNHAFIRSHTGDLTTIPGWEFATGINDSGVVTGNVSDSEAAVYINGRTINVSPNFTTSASLSAINNSNQIAGSFSTSPNGVNEHGLVGVPITI